MIHDKKMIPDEFGVKIGKFEEKDLPAPQLADPPEKVDKVLTYDAAIKSNKEISDLTAEVSRLGLEIKQKDVCIADLESDIAEYEEELDQLSDGTGISDGKAYLEDLVATAIPIADRYFDLQERKIALEEKKLNGQTNGEQLPPPPAHQSPGVQQERQQEQQQPTREQSEEFLDKMDELLKTNPQEYQRIMAEAQRETSSDG